MRYELNFDEDKVNDVLVVGGASYDLKGCCDLLNEQQATIQELERKLNKYAKIGEEQLKQIIELQEENRELRQSVEYWQKKYEEGTETFQID